MEDPQGIQATFKLIYTAYIRNPDFVHPKYSYFKVNKCLKENLPLWVPAFELNEPPCKNTDYLT